MFGIKAWFLLFLSMECDSLGVAMIGLFLAGLVTMFMEYILSLG